jgi:hypothetical protein
VFLTHVYNALNVASLFYKQSIFVFLPRTYVILLSSGDSPVVSLHLDVLLLLMKFVNIFLEGKGKAGPVLN